MIEFMFRDFLTFKKFCILIFLFLLLSFSKHVLSSEIKPLEELLNTNDTKINSLIIMNRCAAIYGALYFINPSDIIVKNMKIDIKYSYNLQS